MSILLQHGLLNVGFICTDGCDSLGLALILFVVVSGAIAVAVLTGLIAIFIRLKKNNPRILWVPIVLLVLAILVIVDYLNRNPGSFEI